MTEVRIRRVTAGFTADHKLMPGYEFIPGMILVEEGDGTWCKTAPGLGLMGFRIPEVAIERLTESLDSHPSIEFL